MLHDTMIHLKEPDENNTNVIQYICIQTWSDIYLLLIISFYHAHLVHF